MLNFTNQTEISEEALEQALNAIFEMRVSSTDRVVAELTEINRDADQALEDSKTRGEERRKEKRLTGDRRA